MNVVSDCIVRGEAQRLPLCDASVDLIVTSPPYFSLRSYQDGGEHYAGQIGAEETPTAFLAALWACTAEWQRVLKPGGSLWINLGDNAPEGMVLGIGRLSSVEAPEKLAAGQARGGRHPA